MVKPEVEQRLRMAKARRLSYELKYRGSVEAGQMDKRMFIDEVNWLNGYIAGLQDVLDKDKGDS